MALCWPSLLLHLFCIGIFSTGVDASISLSNELTNFIPACAQICFTSFLENNFPTSACTDTPDLDCLCSTTSSSGFTVGEGAVQCIIAEKAVGFCTGADAQTGVAVNGYNMCNGEQNAIPNTHQTITASIVLETSNPSVVMIATTSKSISTSSSSSRSSNSFPTPTPATLITSTSASATTSNTSTPTSEEVAAERSAAATSTSEKTKVIAISVGSVGGAALLVGILLLFVCLRRRRHDLRNSNMLPSQADPGFSRFYTPFRGPIETKSAKSAQSSNGTWSGPTPPVPPRLDTSDRFMFSRRSIKPDTIGLAISPERYVPMERNRSSRLLPDKPVLRLNTQQPMVTPGVGLRPAPGHQQLSRQSTATQFEEDDSTDTVVDEYYGRDSTDRMINNEYPDRQTIKVVPPDSQPGFYITNPDTYPTGSSQIQYANSPEYQVKPLAIGRSVGSFSRPRPGPEQNGYQLQVPTRSTPQNLNIRPITAGSSVYSSASNTPYTAAPSSGPLDSNPFPVPPISQSQYQVPPNLKPYKQYGPYDRESEGSFTSFDSVDSSPVREQPRHTLMLDLSPVVESPASASGRSPVSYPKIAPPRRLSQQTIRMVPPPPQPDFASIFSSGEGRIQSANPNLNPNQKPWQAAELAAARQRRLSAAQPRSQSYPVPQIHDPEPQLQLNNPTFQNQRRQSPKLAPPFQPRTLQQQPRAHLPSNPRPQPQQQQQYNHQRQRSRDYIAPSAHFNTQTHPNPNPTIVQPPRSSSQTPSISSLKSTNSSLLAKRLGADKALALNLTAKTEDDKRGGAKWRVLGREDREAAKSPGWRPQLVGKMEQGRAGSGQSAGWHAGYGSGSEGDLPRTAQWVPKLTPTRRGDELFLSVA